MNFYSYHYYRQTDGLSKFTSYPTLFLFTQPFKNQVPLKQILNCPQKWGLNKCLILSLFGAIPCLKS